MNQWEKEIYEWDKGRDDTEDIAILNALNRIISGLAEIESYGWDYIFENMNIMGKYEALCEYTVAEMDIPEIMVKFEVIRTLLFGGKIKYNFLCDHLNKFLSDWQAKGGRENDR